MVLLPPITSWIWARQLWASVFFDKTGIRMCNSQIFPSSKALIFKIHSKSLLRAYCVPDARHMAILSIHDPRWLHFSVYLQQTPWLFLRICSASNSKWAKEWLLSLQECMPIETSELGITGQTENSTAEGSPLRWAPEKPHRARSLPDGRKLCRPQHHARSPIIQDVSILLS